MHETTGIRVVVVQPATAPLRVPAALSRLGPQAEIEVTRDVASALAFADRHGADAIVVDAALAPGGDCDPAALREGPPLLVAGASLATGAALAWFRAGAADCVALDRDDTEGLAAAVLEQIRRHRAAQTRRAAQRHIRELEQLNAGVLEAMSDALLLVDAKALVTRCNGAAAELLGRSADELLGVCVASWFEASDGEGLVSRCLARRQRLRSHGCRVELPDGSQLPVRLSCAPLLGEDGEVRGAVATFQDLTELRQLERQVLHAEKMASIGQLAAGVAHEINNPMGFIHANLFQMSEYVVDLRKVWARLEPLLDARGATPAKLCEVAGLAEELDVPFLLGDLAKAIRESQEGSERIRHIVQDLRDFSHEEGAEPVLADLNQCLDSTANIVWPMLKHLVVLEREYGDLPQILCHPMQLKQVFMNLLVNAYQAVEEKVGGTGNTGRIALHSARVGDRAVICVSDDGAGMSPEVVERVFDPFFTTKKVGAGTGLGLSTCYSIVARHAGAIEVESEPGVGSAFRVVLPFGEAPDDEA